MAKVLRRLTEARLVVEGKETDDQPYIEPAHDELVRGWDRLLDWARKGQEGLLLRRILTPAADDWKRGSGGLWHANPRLALVRAGPSSQPTAGSTKRSRISCDGACSRDGPYWVALLRLSLWRSSCCR